MPELESVNEAVVELGLNIASADNTSAFGRLVADIEQTEVNLRAWPQRGMLAVLTSAKSTNSIYTQRDIDVSCDGALIYNMDPRFGNGGNMVAGQLAKTHELDTNTHVQIGNVRRQPDSGVVYFPQSKKPFIMLLAAAKDDVQPTDFQALYFLGDQGFHVDPGVWHQYPYPVNANDLKFTVKESKVYSSETIDFSTKLGQEMRFPVDHKHIQALLGSDVIPDVTSADSDEDSSDSDQQQSYDVVGESSNMHQEPSTSPGTEGEQPEERGSAGDNDTGERIEAEADD